jgi:hypothetical protein
MTVVRFIVLNEGGLHSEECVDDVTIEIVAGHGIGRRVQQANGCTAYEPDFRATFDNVPAGVELTVRASAPGYAPAEKTVIPKAVWYPPFSDYYEVLTLSRVAADPASAGRALP